MKILWISVLFLMFLQTSVAQTLTKQDMHVSKGKLDVYGNFSSEYVNSRAVRVWLPEGYNNKNKYAVLYMHDGQMLFDAKKTWNGLEWKVDEVASQLIQNKKTKPFIVVGIDNGDSLRFNEYFPKKSLAYLPANKQSEKNALSSYELKADNYLAFLVKELKPFIDANYSVHQNKANTFVMGSSMGGLISMYAISEYPEIFGRAACLSTHWLGVPSREINPVAEGFYGYMEQHLPSSKNHKLYFDHGTETLDQFYPPLQKEVDKIIKSKGYNQKNWQTLSFEGANHSEESWADRLAIPLQFLFNDE